MAPGGAVRAAARSAHFTLSCSGLLSRQRTCAVGSPRDRPAQVDVADMGLLLAVNYITLPALREELGESLWRGWIGAARGPYNVLRGGRHAR
jgi:hypothetical protein